MIRSQINAMSGMVLIELCVLATAGRGFGETGMKYLIYDAMNDNRY
ncbi:MAG: hypothetical protein WBA46_11360 [Thermomicrobiales bacterium]